MGEGNNKSCAKAALVRALLDRDGTFVAHRTANPVCYRQPHISRPAKGNGTWKRAP